jgi:hypothetical protein
VNVWTVIFDRSVAIHSWAEDKPLETIAAVHGWVADCMVHGPTADEWLVELENGYRFRYWLIEADVTVEFIAVTYERWMMITKID